MAYDITLDVGGTRIKAGALDQRARLLTPIRQYPSLAAGTAGEIFGQLTSAILDTAEAVKGRRAAPAFVAMTFPGPFDYARGVALMQGLAKYDAIYGMSVLEEVRRRTAGLIAEGTPFFFCHDAEAFAEGACHHTRAKGHSRVMHLCVGTGAGSAFTLDGALLMDGEYGLPQKGWIHATPMLGQTIDDIISARGLEALAKDVCGQALDGARLSILAAQQEEGALRTWQAFGDRVVQATGPFLETFGADALVLGGQIAKAFPYFGRPLAAYCAQRGIQVIVCGDSSLLAMQGLQRIGRRRMEKKNERGTI